MAARPIVVTISGDDAKLKKSLAKASKRVDNFGAKIGAMGKAAGKAFAAVGVGAAVGAFKIQSSFEEANKAIAVGTGATGEALEGLQDSFKKIAQNVPNNMGDVANAVADVNTRLGLTGEDLEDFTTQMLNLARITGTDVQANITSVSRALGDWGDLAGEAADASDYLFTISQMTGLGVDKLSNQLVQFGAPLRQLGFSFEESAALLGKFEKEGVNAELVMGSMRIALGTMAREGEPAIETFERVTDEIKNAGSASEANAIALKLFGARAGPDMAAAIREGRFELEDFKAVMEGQTNSINDTAAETETMTEKFARFRNFLTVKLAPVVEKVFDKLAEVIPPIVAKVKELGTVAFAAVAPRIERVIKAVRTFAEKHGPGLLKIVKRVGEALLPFVKRLKDLPPLLQSVGDFVRRNADIFLVLGGAIAGLVIGFKAYAVATKAIAAAKAIATTAVAAFNVVMAMNPIGLVVIALVALAAALAVAYTRFEGVREVIDSVFGFIGDKLVPIFTDTLMPVVKEVIGFIGDRFQFIWDHIKNVVDLISALFRGDFKRVWQELKDIIKNIAGEIFTVLIEIPAKIISELVPKIGEALGKVLDKFSDLVGDIGRKAVDVGKAIINGIARGVRDAAGFVGDFAKGVANAIIGFFNDKVIQYINDKIPDKINIPFAPDINIPDNPLPHIPYLAKGGIIQGPTLAMLGDNASGTEMVVPLEKANAMGFGGGNTINLTVNAGLGADGTQIGAQILSYLKQWERSNGALPISVTT